MANHKRLTHWSWVFACSLIVAGCQQRGPQTVQVEGIVTFDGGSCPAPGMIVFQPVKAAEGFSLRPGSATFELDGTFTATSFEPDDGLVPGTYDISITCWKERPMDMTPGVSYVPAGYKPERLVITPDTRGPVKVTYDVPLR